MNVEVGSKWINREWRYQEVKPGQKSEDIKASMPRVEVIEHVLIRGYAGSNVKAVSTRTGAITVVVPTEMFLREFEQVDA